MLEGSGITALVDVRSSPRSRFAPWSNRARLEAALGEAAITGFPEFQLCRALLYS